MKQTGRFSHIPRKIVRIKLLQVCMTMTMTTWNVQSREEYNADDDGTLVIMIRDHH